MGSKTVNPHAYVLIWNYKDRIIADGATEPHEIEQVIINSASLLSISTSKTKSSPAGTFEISLAPTFNWIARITPGSWCVINMSQSKIVENISGSNLGNANPKEFKMLGRIDSVRVVVSVDSQTGARLTNYVVTGQDWASVFNTRIYIDPVARNNNLDRLSAVGHAARILFDEALLDWIGKKDVALPSPSNVIEAIIELWGNPIKDISAAVDDIRTNLNESNNRKIQTDLTITSQSQFKIPSELSRYMGFKSKGGDAAVCISSILTRYEGVLDGKDQYSGDTREAHGFPDPASFYGINSFWQLLVDNCNAALNELVADVRWEGDKPALALYKRIKPFANRKTFIGTRSEDPPTTHVTKNLSLFKNIRQIIIDKNDVLTINAGTNWRDKVNFIEIQPQQNLLRVNLETQVKLDAQTVDLLAFERDGFKPLLQRVNYMPYDGGTPAPLAATEWKYLLREWYFNTHNMLDGSMSIIGQDRYIQVGDNIKVDAGILGTGPFNIGQDNQRQSFLLAHVESISNQFGVDPNTGARTFITTIAFVRGIIVDSNDNALSVAQGGFGNFGESAGGTLDKDASSLATPREKNTNVLGTSTENDHDTDKLRGR